MEPAPGRPWLPGRRRLRRGRADQFGAGARGEFGATR